MISGRSRNFADVHGQLTFDRPEARHRPTLLARHALDKFDASEAFGRPILINGDSAHTLKGGFAQRCPTCVHVDRAFESLRCALWVGEPHDRVSCGFSCDGFRQGVDFLLLSDKCQGIVSPTISDDKHSNPSCLTTSTPGHGCRSIRCLPPAERASKWMYAFWIYSDWIRLGCQAHQRWSLQAAQQHGPLPSSSKFLNLVIRNRLRYNPK